jgi:hypothetical protein
MAELLLLNLAKDSFTRLHRAAENGDQDARAAIIHLWDQYSDRELLCFLCNSTDCQPIFAQILPDRNDHQLIAAPLCLRCRELSHMVRLGRSLRTLKKMWSGGKEKNKVAFHFNPSQQHHPR